MAMPLLEWGHFLYSVIGLYYSALFIYDMACIKILHFGLFFVVLTHVC